MVSIATYSPDTPHGSLLRLRDARIVPHRRKSTFHAEYAMTGNSI
jgi:hypothetical protein